METPEKKTFNNNINIQNPSPRGGRGDISSIPDPRQNNNVGHF
jgi:hypothetical protein